MTAPWIVSDETEAPEAHRIISQVLKTLKRCVFKRRVNFLVVIAVLTLWAQCDVLFDVSGVARKTASDDLSG